MGQLTSAQGHGRALDGMERGWFVQKDPLHERPHDVDTLQDFDSVPLDQAYLEATGRPRRK